MYFAEFILFFILFYFRICVFCADFRNKDLVIGLRSLNEATSIEFMSGVNVEWIFGWQNRIQM